MVKPGSLGEWKESWDLEFTSDFAMEKTQDLMVKSHPVFELMGVLTPDGDFDVN